MNLRLLQWLRSISLLALLSAVFVLTTGPRSQAEPLPLDRAIRLAIAHSTSSAIAGADVQRALASYREIHDNYVPQLFLGSGLGYSYGFPLSIEGAAPALANATAQSTVFNASQRQFVNAACVRLHRAEARGSADVLRHHLATLTGLPVSTIEIAPETIPSLPPVAAEEDLSEKAVASSPAIKIAEQHSLAQSMRAVGEHRAIYPTIDFSAQYARLSTINNY